MQLSSRLKHLSLETNIWNISETCIKNLKATVNILQVQGILTSSYTFRLGYSTGKINRFPDSVLYRLEHLDSITLHFWQHKNKVLKSSKNLLQCDSATFLRRYRLNNSFAKGIWNWFDLTLFFLKEFLFLTMLSIKTKEQMTQKETMYYHLECPLTSLFSAPPYWKPFLMCQLNSYYLQEACKTAASKTNASFPSEVLVINTIWLVYIVWWDILN